MPGAPMHYTPPEETDLGDFYKAYGVTREREQISDFFKDNGFQKSPFGYVPPNPGAGTAASVVNYAQKAKNQYKKALGMMPDLPELDLTDLQNDRKNVYNNFSRDDSVAAGNEARSYGRDVAVSAANDAAREFSTSQGGNKVGAAVIRARSLIPAMASDTQVALQLAQMKEDARRDASVQATNIAGQMANLRSGYINTLANYNADKARNALGYADLVTTNARARDTSRDSQQQDWYNRILSLMPTLAGVPREQIT